MATFAEHIEQERARIQAAQEDLAKRRAALNEEAAQLERDMRAVSAYDREKSGKTVSTIPSGRAPRGSRAQTLLALIAGNPKGMTRAQILESVGAKGNKSEEGSISNALTNLKKQGQLTLESGVYRAA